MFEQEDVNKLNSDIDTWRKKNDTDLVSEMNSLGIKHYKYSPNKIPLRRAVKSKIRQRFGLTERIRYTMPRSAVFVHKGVSKGHPISNPRTKKEWYEPVVNRNLDELADIVADGQGNMIINALKIR